MKRVLRKDVAKYANVSETTVSVVLNNNKDIIISPETRQKVLDAAKELGYYPHHAAKTMAGKRSYTLGVLSPWNTRVWYFSDTLNGIRQAASENNYGVMLCNMLKMQDTPEDCIRYFMEGRIDGVVYLPPYTKEMPGLAQLREANIPTVICNGVDPYGDTDTIAIDYAAGIYKAVEFLYREGFENLIYILPYEQRDLCTGDAERFRGFLQAAETYKFKANKEIICLSYPIEERIEIARKIVEKCPKPLGVISCYANQGYYIQMATLEAGLKPGIDVKVIAGDTGLVSDLMYPALAGIELPFHKIGEMSATILINRLEGKAAERTFSVIEGEYPFLGDRIT